MEKHNVDNFNITKNASHNLLKTVKCLVGLQGKVGFDLFGALIALKEVAVNIFVNLDFS